MAQRNIRQPYPREDDPSLLAKYSLFPKLSPPLSRDAVKDAIKQALIRAKTDKAGDPFEEIDTPQKLVKECIQHMMERSDPILSTNFYSQLDVDEVFDMDAIAHEMQRQRMKIGVFYQYLLIELMKASRSTEQSNIIRFFDGSREGDAVADIETPGFDKNLRLYISVKKSVDTVGGQDVGGVINRLETIAKQERNRTSPYLCVIAIATPPGGLIREYTKSRNIRYTQDNHPYSENCEIWLPGFLYPYITGWNAKDIYKESLALVDEHLPFFSLKFRDECSELLKKQFMELGLADSTGHILKDRFFGLTTREA
jgi:hypothetical protein